MLALRAQEIWQTPCLCPYVSERPMLKISMVEGKDERRLIVEGKLVGPWAAELESVCAETGNDLRNRGLIIDMRHLTAISQEGEKVLCELIQKGVKFRCRGVFTKHVLKLVARRANGKLGRRKSEGAGWQSCSQRTLSRFSTRI